MTLPEARRGFPTYRSVSGAEPARDDIDLGRVSVPSLVHSGSEDDPDRNGRTAQAPGVDFFELPGLENRSGLSATDRVMAVIEPFLVALPALSVKGGAVDRSPGQAQVR